MNQPNFHPSFLALDRYRLGLESPELKAHVEGCERCGRHLARLDEPTQAPAWIRERTERHGLLAWMRATWPQVALASTLAAVLVAVASQMPSHDRSGIRAKAALPSVALYVKRGERVLLWDGRASLLAGDLLRLEVAPEGYRHIRVTSPSADSGATLLHDGELHAGGASFLPVSWRIDGDRQTEVLEIELTKGARGEPWRTRLQLSTSPTGVLP